MIESQPTQKRKNVAHGPLDASGRGRASEEEEEEEERKAAPLICPTIHPLAMMTVSDGNLQNLKIGSTTNSATDPNREPPSLAENVLSNHIA